MKIQKLSLTNFSSHTSTSIEFTKPCGLIVGALGVGKSSLAQAIEYALTGECAAYRKRTDDRTELIHDLVKDQRGFNVTIETDCGKFSRTRSPIAETAAMNEGTAVSLEAMNSAVCSALNVSKTVISAVLNVSGFFDLEPAAQKELIIGLIGAEVTDKKVRALFTGEPEALELLGGPVDSLAAIQNAHSYAYDSRTVIRRELKELKPPAPPEGQPPPIEKLRALMAQVEGELESKVAAQARIEGQSQAAAVRDRLSTRIKELKQVVHPGSDTTLQEVRRTAVDAQSNAADLYKALESKLVTVRAQILARGQNVKLLADFNGRCVAGDHACPAPASDMTVALAEQQRLLKKGQTDAQKLEAELLTLRAQRDDTSALQTADNRLARHKDTLTTFDRAQREIQQITSDLAQMEVAPSNPEQMTLLATEIATLRERITKGRNQLEAARSWLERERQVKAVAEQRARLEKKLSHLEALVEFFGAKGVKVQLIDERIGQFVESINVHLKHFGFTLGIQVEPWRIMKDGRPISRLSRSERFRLSIPFQIAIARMTGLNFVLCDDAELLTPDVRSKMFQMLLSAGLDQVLVVMTWMNEQQFMDNRAKLPASIEPFVVRNEAGISTVSAI